MILIWFFFYFIIFSTYRLKDQSKDYRYPRQRTKEAADLLGLRGRIPEQGIKFKCPLSNGFSSSNMYIYTYTHTYIPTRAEGVRYTVSKDVYGPPPRGMERDVLSFHKHLSLARSRTYDLPEPLDAASERAHTSIFAFSVHTYIHSEHARESMYKGVNE